MSGEISTIQSLKAVDAWIDVINANINGGVRTAFKSSRLKFSGSNTDIQRAGNSTSLPLQFPESGLTTTNTVIDFSQGAITASTENTHLAIQGEGFFLLGSPNMIDKDGIMGGDGVKGETLYTTGAQFLLTRDGEFHTDAQGLLVHSSGYYLLLPHISGGVPFYSTTVTGGTTALRAVYNDIDNPLPVGGTQWDSARLSEFITGYVTHTTLNMGGVWPAPGYPSLVHVSQGAQSLRYSQLGSTVYDFGFRLSGGAALGTVDSNIRLASGPGTILTKSLEASNASMTQSVPELSLAQKLFSALTKVLQTKQTNVDGVLNLVR